MERRTTTNVYERLLSQLEAQLRKEVEQLEAKEASINRRLHAIDALEAELEAREKILQTICMVFEIDPEGKITYVNDLFLKTTGYSSEDVIGKPYNNLKHPDSPAATLNQMWDTVKKGKVWRGILKNRNKEGSAYYTETLTVPIKQNGKPTRFLSVQFDITKHVSLLAEYEENMRHAVRIQKALMANMNDLENFENPYFYIYKPLHRVGGDFLFHHFHKNSHIFVLGDAFGHGLSASLFAIVTLEKLHKIIKEKHTYSPSAILESLDTELTQLKEESEENLLDACDLVAAVYQPKHRRLTITSLSIPCFIWRKATKTLEEIPMYKVSVGGKKYKKEDLLWEDRVFDLEEGDIVYLMTDGIRNQIGEQTARPLGKSGLTKLLQQVAPHPLKEQKQVIEEVLKRWRGKEPQTDDTLLFAFQV